MTRYVRQEDPYGCTVACIAMVAGVSYARAKEIAGPALSERGMIDIFVDGILGELGFAHVTKYRWLPGNRQRDEWPVAPFAPVHVAAVTVPAGAHSIVVCADGRVHDPWDENRVSLADPIYLEIGSVRGFYRVTGKRS